MIQGALVLLILFAPLLAASEEAAPGAGLEVGSLEATHSNGTVYRFPQAAGESLAASRINTYLQTVALRKLPGHYEKSAFEDVWPQGDSPHGVISLDYSVAFHQPGILSVDVFGESYGAYLSATGGTFYFDARTGEVITLRSLFSAEELAKLDQEITQARLREVDDFLAGKPLPDGTKLRSEPEDAEIQKVLYRECRGSIEKGRPSAQDRLRLEREQLSLVRDPCAPHGMQALDDLVFRTTRRYEEMGTLLNEYGRCLLVARRTDCQRQYSGIEAGVYRGKIGDRYPITLVVEGAGSRGGVQATYFYDKHGKPIDLTGTAAKEGGVQLDERGPPPARFALRMQPDRRLVGEWTQQGKAPLKVELR